MRKGQLATENIVLISGLVFISLILFYYGARQISETHKISKAEDAVSHLAEKVNELATLTTGTRDSVWVEIPSRVLEVRLAGKHISLVLLRANGEQYILTKNTFADVIGSVNLSIGVQQVFVTKVNDTTVKLGTEPMILELAPMCISDNDLATTVTLYGADLLPTSAPTATGAISLPYTFVNVATITMGTMGIWKKIHTTPTQINLMTPLDQQSNSVCFHIYSSGTSCACDATGTGTGD